MNIISQIWGFSLDYKFKQWKSNNQNIEVVDELVELPALLSLEVC